MGPSPLLQQPCYWLPSTLLSPASHCIRPAGLERPSQAGGTGVKYGQQPISSGLSLCVLNCLHMYRNVLDCLCMSWTVSVCLILSLYVLDCLCVSYTVSVCLGLSPYVQTWDVAQTFYQIIRFFIFRDFECSKACTTKSIVTTLTGRPTTRV